MAMFKLVEDVLFRVFNRDTNHIEISDNHPDPEMRKIINDLFELYPEEVKNEQV